MPRGGAPLQLAARAGAVAAIALVLSGCTYPSDDEAYARPAPPPLGVSVDSDPPARADGTVPRNARFVVQLDGYVDPDSVGFGALQVRSGRGNFDFSFKIAVVNQQIVVTPRSLLLPGGRYDLIVSHLVTLDDRVQTVDVVFPVVAGTDVVDAAPAAPPPTWNGSAADGSDGVRAVIGNCAPFCHSPVGASGRMRTPTRLLDLTGDPLDPVLGLVNVPSVGLRGSPAELPRVAPFDPARSVLLRKLLGGSPQADSKDPPYPNMRVDGRRMPIPLDEAEPGAPLSTAEIQRVEDWIAGGAPIQ